MVELGPAGLLRDLHDHPAEPYEGQDGQRHTHQPKAPKNAKKLEQFLAREKAGSQEAPGKDHGNLAGGYWFHMVPPLKDKLRRRNRPVPQRTE